MRQKALIGLTLTLTLGVLLILFFILNQANSNDDIKEGYPYLIGVSVSDARIPWIKNFLNELEENDKLFLQSNLLVRESLGSSEKQISDLEDLTQHHVDLIMLIPQEAKACEKFVERVEDTPVLWISPCVNTMQTPIRVPAKDEKDSRLAYLSTDYKSTVLDMAREMEAVIDGERKLIFMYDPRSEQERELLHAFEYALGKEWQLEAVECRGQRGEAQNRMIDYIVSKKTAKILVGANAEQAFGAYLAMHKLRSEGYKFYAFDQYLAEAELTKLDGYVQNESISIKAKEIAEAVLAKKAFPNKTVLKYKFQSK